METHQLTTTRRDPAGIRFIRVGVFWLLAVEGACLGALLLVSAYFSFVTHHGLLAQLWQHNPIVVLAFGILALVSLRSTAQRIHRRAWSGPPRLLLPLVTIGGGLLFYQTFLGAFPAPLIMPYRLLVALTAIALALYLAVFLRGHLRSGAAAAQGQVEASARGQILPSAGSALCCGRCGAPNPRHLVSLQDGSQPTHLCEACYQLVIRPKTAFQEYRPKEKERNADA